MSTIDLLPTLAELAGVSLAGVSLADVMPRTDGESLVPHAAGGGRQSPVAMEYAAEGSKAPLVCLRAGRFKHVRCALHPDLLYDLEADPQERTNLASDPAHAPTLARLRAQSEARWDLAAHDAEERGLLPLGLPAAPEGVGTLHAQPHGPDRA